MKNKKIRFLSLILSANLCLSYVPISYANEFDIPVDVKDNSIEYIEYQTTNDEDFKNSTSVFAKLASEYKVTIPKIIILSGTDKKADYFVKIQGDIAGYEEIEVVPDDSFLLKTTGKADQTAIIDQDKTTWTVHNFDKNANGTVSAQDITAGKWQGTFNFNITFKENGIVKENKLSLDVENESLAMGAGQTTKIQAFYNGKDVTEDVTWTSDNNNIKVNDGIITTSALAKPGDTANITAELENKDNLSAMLEKIGIVSAFAGESNKIASFTVTIVSIDFENETGNKIENIEILPGNSAKVSAKLVPELDDTVSWSYTAPAGISLKKNKNEVEIFVSSDMPVGKVYNIIATYGDYSNIINLTIKDPHIHEEKEPIEENIVEATCLENGSYDEVIYCNTCGKQLSKTHFVIKKLGHNYKDVVTMPTHSQKGFTTHTCTRCGDTFTDSEVDIIPHTYDNGIITKAPTCEEDGIKTFTCSCGDSYTVVLKAQGHTEGSAVKENEIAATCLENGSYENVSYCTVCNKKLSSVVKVVNKLGHNYKNVVTSPTCTEKGFTTHICSRCNDTYKDSYTNALDHNWTVSVKTAATCDSDSTEAYICTRCSDTKVTHDTKKLGHTKTNKKVVNPTCTAQGYTQYTCGNCGKVFTEDVKASLGHEYINGKCTRCGDFNVEMLEAGLYSVNNGTYTQISSWQQLLNNNTYKVNNGTLTFCDWNSTTAYSAHYSDLGTNTFLVIDKSVKTIQESSLKNAQISGLYIPESVTKITSIRDLKKLSTIYVSKNSNSFVVKDGVLFTKNMKTLVLAPRTVTGSYTIPSSVQTVQSMAFECSKYSSITIPEGVLKLENGCMRNMSNVTIIYIPKTVQTLTGAFAGDPKLMEYVLDSTNPYFTLNDGVIYSKDMKTILSCPQGRTAALNIPNTVTAIAANTCDGCTKLSAVTMTNNVGTIGWGAFRNCKSLTTITIPNKIKRLENCLFSGVQFANITIPANVEFIDTNALSGSKKVTFEDTSHKWEAVFVTGGNTNSKIPSGQVYLTDPAQNATYFNNSSYYKWYRR